MTGGRVSGESKFEGFTIISSWLELEEPTSSTPWFSVSESCRTSSLIVCRLSGLSSVSHPLSAKTGWGAVVGVSSTPESASGTWGFGGGIC